SGFVGLSGTSRGLYSFPGDVPYELRSFAEVRAAVAFVTAAFRVSFLAVAAEAAWFRSERLAGAGSAGAFRVGLRVPVLALLVGAGADDDAVGEVHTALGLEVLRGVVAGSEVCSGAFGVR